MTHDDVALRRTVLLHPSDQAPLLIIADWYEEHDQPELALLYRARAAGLVFVVPSLRVEKCHTTDKSLGAGVGCGAAAGCGYSNGMGAGAGYADNATVNGAGVGGGNANPVYMLASDGRGYGNGVADGGGNGRGEGS